MNLKELKAAAVAKLANVHPDIQTYATALESKVGARKYWIVGAVIVVGVALFLLRHHIK